MSESGRSEARWHAAQCRNGNQQETKRASQSQETALVTVDQWSNQTKKQTPQNKHKEALKLKTEEKLSESC